MGGVPLTYKEPPWLGPAAGARNRTSASHGETPHDWDFGTGPLGLFGGSGGARVGHSEEWTRIWTR